MKSERDGIPGFVHRTISKVRRHRARAVAAAMVLLAAAAHAAGGDYGVREDEARSGTMIRSYSVTGAVVPIDKKFAELDATERADLNKLYGAIGAGDEPPFPLDGLRPIYTAMAKAQKAFLVKGDMTLVVTVDLTGEPQEVRSVGAADPNMAQVGAVALMQTKFKPALCAGRPCRMDFPVRFEFPQRGEYRVVR
jgi:hypothetical protein